MWAPFDAAFLLHNYVYMKVDIRKSKLTGRIVHENTSRADLMDWEPDIERSRPDHNSYVMLDDTPFGGLSDSHQPSSYSQLNTV
jgi:hypothetical protein